MSNEKVYVWPLRMPSGEMIIFSTTGEDREEAENKMFAFAKARPLMQGPSPELMLQWIKTTIPLTPEINEGVWMLQLTTSVERC